MFDGVQVLSPGASHEAWRAHLVKQCEQNACPPQTEISVQSKYKRYFDKTIVARGHLDNTASGSDTGESLRSAKWVYIRV